jgi:hypothetical protein
MGPVASRQLEGFLAALARDVFAAATSKEPPDDGFEALSLGAGASSVGAAPVSRGVEGRGVPAAATPVGGGLGLAGADADASGAADESGFAEATSSGAACSSAEVVGAADAEGSALVAVGPLTGRPTARSRGFSLPLIQAPPAAPASKMTMIGKSQTPDLFGAG